VFGIWNKFKAQCNPLLPNESVHSLYLLRNILLLPVGDLVHRMSSIKSVGPSLSSQSSCIPPTSSSCPRVSTDMRGIGKVMLVVEVKDAILLSH